MEKPEQSASCGHYTGMVNRILTETQLSLSQAAKRIRGGRANTQIHPATLTRWILSGTKSATGRRVKLEAVRVGSRWVTSAEAITRFVASLTGNTDGGAAGATPPSCCQRPVDTTPASHAHPTPAGERPGRRRAAAPRVLMMMHGELTQVE